MSAIAIPDTWGAEPLRRRPVPAIPTAAEFLWSLADVTRGEALFVGDIAQRLGVRSCRERVSKAGTIYATLKALMGKGLVAYESDGRTQGKYRLTPAGLTAVDRSPEWAADEAYWRAEARRRDIEARIARHKGIVRALEAELRGMGS